MSRSTQKYARLAAIESKGKLGSVLIRLMMVINDMSLAMDAQRRWTEDAKMERQHRERGAKIYFVRLQLSHIYEAMDIIQEIRDNPELMKAVDRSDSYTKNAFVRLLQVLESAEYEKVMGRIRNNLTFHYDPKTIDRALASLVARYPDASGSISLGDDPHNWYFEPGDIVGDRAAVREIFRVSEDADVAVETDRIIARLHEIVQMFGGFAGSFIWQNSK